MHGGNFGWVKKIAVLLKSHMNMEHNEIHKLVAHHRMVYQLHSIIRHAAVHSHAMIHRLFKVMKHHGFNMKNSKVMHAYNALIRGSKKNFKSLHTIKHSYKTVTHHSKSFKSFHHSVYHHTKTIQKHFSFSSTGMASRTVKWMLKKWSAKHTYKVL